MISTIVIGATTFLGSHIVDALTKRGEHVLVIDNLRIGKLGYIADAVRSGRLTYAYVDDQIDSDSLRKIFSNSKIERIRNIYCVETLPDTSYSASPHPQALLETAARNGAGVIFTITVGGASRTPELGDLDLGKSPDFTRRSRDFPHGALARFQAAALIEANQHPTLNVRMVRAVGLYGPRMPVDDDSLMPVQIRAAERNRPIPVEGPGDLTRTFTYVDDAVAFLLSTWNKDTTSLSPIDIGSPDQIKSIDVAQDIATLANVDFRPACVLSSTESYAWPPLDFSRAQSIGWKSVTPLQRGLRKTYRWFTTNAESYV